MKNIVARIVAWFSGDLMQKILSCIPDIVAEVEKMAADGIITADERKVFALKAVDIVAAKFNFKMNGWTKWVVGVIIDNIAKKLPTKDVQIPQVIMDLKKQIGG
ncbi:MAG: hypothetical protein WC738_03720 [Candidatus Omnitrophota bacterium]